MVLRTTCLPAHKHTLTSPHPQNSCLFSWRLGQAQRHVCTLLPHTAGQPLFTQGACLHVWTGSWGPFVSCYTQAGEAITPVNEQIKALRMLLFCTSTFVMRPYKVLPETQSQSLGRQMGQESLNPKGTCTCFTGVLVTLLLEQAPKPRSD